MSSNLGTILSMIMVVSFLLLGGDMVCLSASYSSLDSVSHSISYLIAKERRCDEDYLSYLESKYEVSFYSISTNYPVSGDVVTYVIGREYSPLIISNTSLALKVKRTTVVGYYG